EGHTMQLIGKVNEALDSKMENLQNMTYLIAFDPDIRAFMEGKTDFDGHTGTAVPYNDLNRAKDQDQLYGIKQYLQGFTTLYPEIAGIVLVNRNGDYISNEMYPKTNQSLVQEEWYQSAAGNAGIFTVLGQPRQRNI
ncbi:histidine kinase, partial [Escherichia coli]|nr:histidine kinase [Escherichia coli]